MSQGNERLSDIALAIFEIASQRLDRHARAVRLRAHEGEDGLKNLIGQGAIMRPHALPEIIGDALDRDRAVREHIPA